MTMPTSTGAGRFDGRVAIVTGAGRGIGRATAHRLASEGATVVVNDVDDAAIKDTVSSMASLPGRAVEGRGDITDEAQVVELAHRTIADHGGVDILVNNAGGAMP